MIKTFQIVGAEGDDGVARCVDVAAQRDRVVYRLKNSSDSPLHEMFVAAKVVVRLNTGRAIRAEKLTS